MCPILPEYEASSKGRIRRVEHEVAMPNGGVRVNGGKAWFGTWAEDRERFIFMFKGKTYKVARVVCAAFHGPPPFEDAVAMHMDENSRNNKPGNLEWGTQKQNLNAPGFIAYCKTRTGNNSPTRKGLKK